MPDDFPVTIQQHSICSQSDRPAYQSVAGQSHCGHLKHCGTVTVCGFADFSHTPEELHFPKQYVPCLLLQELLNSINSIINETRLYAKRNY